MLLAGKTHPGVPRPAGQGRVAPREVLLYSDSEPSKSLTSSNQSEARSIKVQLAQKTSIKKSLHVQPKDLTDDRKHGVVTVDNTNRSTGRIHTSTSINYWRSRSAVGA